MNWTPLNPNTITNPLRTEVPSAVFYLGLLLLFYLLQFFVQLILTLSVALAESRRTTNYVVLFKITSETFSVELKDRKSPSYKSLADGLEFEVQISYSTSVVNNLFCSSFSFSRLLN